MQYLVLAQGGGDTSALFLTFIVPFAVIMVIFYFLMIRPQKKEEKQRQEMLKNLKKNDKVVTIGGIFGLVANVREEDVTLKIDESGDVRVRFTRSAIARIVTRGDSEQAKEQ